LAAPDADSRTPDEDGRRIVLVSGGWRIVNARKYREMQTNGQRLASERSKRYRERVTQRDDRDASRASRTEGEGKSKSKGKGERKATNGNGSAPSAPASAAIVPIIVTWNQRACDVVIQRYGGTAPGGRITKALRPLVGKHGDEAVLQAWTRYVDETPAEFLSPEKFATVFGRYVGDAGAPANSGGRRIPEMGTAAALTRMGYGGSR
jgi:hypothetical protein